MIGETNIHFIYLLYIIFFNLVNTIASFVVVLVDLCAIKSISNNGQATILREG